MRPCPVRIRTRRVYVGESDSAPLRSIYVRDLTLQAGVNRARRGPALASPVDAGRADEWHGETWSFEITQELYASYDEHDVLLRACAMVATPIDDDDLRRYAPAPHARSARVPCYIEIIEIGGNVLRATDCVGTVRLSADPADIPRLVFSMTGRFLGPVDAPAIPIAPRVGARPVLYRNADLYVDDIGLITCPAVEFETGGSVYETPELHRPNGVALDSYHDTTARLTLDGTLTARESSQLVWSVRRGDELTLALPDDEVELSLYDWTIDPPAHTTEGPFLAYALTFRADSWSLTLPRDRSLGVAPTINPVGEDIDGTRYVFTEDVEITGTGQPNSTITVNGQSVVVDSDGEWTTMVTLSEGPNTITAQAGDGQIAQADVTLFSEQSVDLMLPRAYLRRGEGLYIDSNQSTPAVEQDPVGAWVDEVRGVAFTQDVSAQRPVAFAGGIQLISGDVGKRLTAAGLSFGPDVSVYAMVRMTGIANTRRPSIGCATPANSVITGWAFGRMNSRQMASVWGPSAGQIHNPPPIGGENRFSGTIPDIVRFTLNEDGLATGYLERTGYNGQLDHGPQTTTYDDLSIGSFSNLEGGQEIFELLVFDRILSAEEDGPLMRWLNIRYAQLVEDLA